MILSRRAVEKSERNFYETPELWSTKAKITRIYSKGKYDRFYFVRYFLNAYTYIIEETKQECPGYFEELWDALDKGIDTTLIVPRGHAKTTGILIWILHSICYATTKGILYIAKGTLGQKGIGRIRGEMETNKKILSIFGNLVPANSDDIKDKKLKVWKSSFLEFTNGCWLQTLTMGQSVRGGRPNKIIGDDVQENKDIMNKNLVEKFNTWIFTSLYNTLMPGGSMAIVGTIVGELCLVKYLRDEKKWNTIQYEACDGDMNNILRPEMRTKSSLILRKEAIGTANFNQEYRNIPLQFTNSVIKEHRFKYYTLDGIGGKQLPDKFDKTVLAIDPATTTNTSSDYTGWCLVGHKGDDRYIIRAGQVKLTPLQLEDYIYSLYMRHNPTYVLKEDNIEIGITEHLRKKGVRIESIKASKDKYTRLLDIAYLFEFGNVFFAQDIENELLYQLTHFPDVEHDDIMDASVYGIMGGKSRAVGVYSL